jgi:hypothetical protein
MRRDRITLAFVCLLAAAPRSAEAQQPPTDAGRARFHFGPLGITPRLGIQNLGVDTNVFNANSEPVRDATALITPGIDVWLKVGRVQLSSATTTDWAYFRKTASQRSFNISEHWRVDVDLFRAIPRLGGTYLNTRQRPNDEIDVRVQQKYLAGGVGLKVPLGARLEVDVEARRARFDFTQGASGDPTIGEALNRDSDVVAATGRFDLTPLTALVVRADSVRDRFQMTPARDSDSLRVMPGLEFRPSALISGTAFVGYRRFRTLNPTVPDYAGVVASVELKYVALDAFRIVGQVKRDIDYSLDLSEPFFVSTSVGADVTQMLGVSWDVVARLRRGTLAYRAGTAGGTGRVDRVRLLGLGVGRRLGDDLRIGIDVDQVVRTSALAARTFAGIRVGGSLTYGY